MKYLILFMFYILCNSLFSQSNYTDSLALELEKNHADSTKIDIMYDLALEYIYSEPQKTISYCQDAERLARKNKFVTREIVAINFMGGGYWSEGSLGEALKCFRRSMKLAESVKNEYWITKNMGNIGLIYSGIGNKGLAKNYYLKAYKLLLKIDTSNRLTSMTENIGTMYLELGQYDSASFYYEKSRSLNLDNPSYDTEILNLNLGDLALRQNQLEKADSLIRLSLEVALKKEDTQIISYGYFFLADIHFRRHELDSAFIKAKKAVFLADKSESKETIVKAYKIYSNILHAQQKDKEAYQYYLLAITYEDSLRSEINRNALQVFEYEREQGEVALLKAEKAEQEAIFREKNQKQRWIIFMVFGVLISVLVVSLVIFRGRTKLKIAYQDLSIVTTELQQQNEEIETQSEILQKTNSTLQNLNNQLDIKNKNITSSIQYSLRIQQAILPQKTKIEEHFTESFILYHPRDIVSGDFYWFAKKENTKIIALADCTGHGVSGALMTMIGNNILNQIIHDLKIYSPDEILNVIPELLQKTLMYAETQIADGMDIGILTFSEQKTEYAGAMNPLYYTQNEEFKRIKGDKVPIGGKQLKQNFKYQKHTIPHATLTTFYLCSDGFQDQFGGKNQRKFMTKNFRKLLASISQMPLNNQQKILENTLTEWMQTNKKQTDDITVIGIRC